MRGAPSPELESEQSTRAGERSGSGSGSGVGGRGGVPGGGNRASEKMLEVRIGRRLSGQGERGAGGRDPSRAAGPSGTLLRVGSRAGPQAGGERRDQPVGSTLPSPGWGPRGPTGRASPLVASLVQGVRAVCCLLAVG